jgi:hypothetical protein
MIHEPEYLAPSKLKGGAVKMYNAYARLTTQNRQKVDELLLVHAFMPSGTNAYLSGEDCSAVQRSFRYDQLQEISQEVADAWLYWSLEIASTRPSRLACRKAILGFFSAVFA